MKNELIYLLVLINTLAAYLIIWVFFSQGGFSYSAVLYSFTSTVFLIFQFELLFKSLLKKYFITIVISFAAGLTALLTAVLLNRDLFPLLVLSNLSALLICIPLFLKGALTQGKSIVEFYTSGISAFVINSVAVALLTFGKFIAANIFNTKTANTYVFASVLVTPVFFIGNFVERKIYAAKNTVRHFVNKMILVGLAGFVLYAALVMAAIYFYPGLLPGTIDRNILENMVLIMLIGTAIFSAIHFPLNGILFKEYDVKFQKRLASYYIIFLVICFTGMYSILLAGILDYMFLILLIFSSLLLQAAIKYFVMFGVKGKAEAKAEA